MIGSPTEMALREVRNDLAELGHRAERLELDLVASLIRMAILDLDAALQNDGAASRLDASLSSCFLNLTVHRNLFFLRWF